METSNTKKTGHSSPQSPILEFDIENPSVLSNKTDGYLHDSDDDSDDDNPSVKNMSLAVDDHQMIDSNLSHVEMSPLHSTSSRDKSNEATPKSQANTTSLTTSPDSIDEGRLSTENHIVEHQSQQSSLANRIVRNCELRYLTNLPENNDSNRSQYKFTSIITTDGLYQLNREFHEFRQLLPIDILKEIAPILTNTIYIVECNGDLAYDDLTLAQLTQLEKAVRDHRGYTIIGYSINEEVFLKLIGLNRYEYPPAPDAFPKRALDMINMPIVRDVSVSIRSGAQSLLLFGYLAGTYFQYNTKSKQTYDEFYYNNIQAFLLVSASVAAIDLFFLRSGLFKKDTVLLGINRLRLVEESIIGKSQNWTTYGSMLRIPTPVIVNGLLPVMAYGAIKGFYNDDALYTTSVMNIASQPRFKTFWNGLSFALTTGSFVSLGFSYVVYDVIFSKITDDARGLSQVNNDSSMLQYTACALALLCHCARYPNYSCSTQRVARYTSNISNTLGNIMLDNYAMFAIMSMIMELTIGGYISSNQTGLLALFYGLQPATFIYCFLTTFSTTPDLPEFSIEPNPQEISTITMLHEKIQRIKQFLLSLSPQLETQNPSVELTPTNTTGFIEQTKNRFRLFPLYTEQSQPLSEVTQSSNTKNPMFSGLSSL